MWMMVDDRVDDDGVAVCDGVGDMAVCDMAVCDMAVCD